MDAFGRLKDIMNTTSFGRIKGRADTGEVGFYAIVCISYLILSISLLTFFGAVDFDNGICYQVPAQNKMKSNLDLVNECDK